ncbi:MAG: NAD(P)H-dependent oxidoreductase [Acidobacteriota bacterium]|jgi:NAD(P)H-dependent FMN reductase|nr:MAG: NADPH-dependent FMN reductase [Acidobacteriota bacterium]
MNTKSSTKLGVVIASVREGRVGAPIADWVVERAREHGGFEIDLVDLKEVDLPFLQEPGHPRLRQYTDERTIAWSARIDAIDAFVFVTPEYNWSTPPALANALDHLHQEWKYKPAAFVSYGGVSGGLRGAQATRLRLAAFNMMTIAEGVVIPFVAHHVKDGRFVPSELQVKAATVMLRELRRWSDALRTLRATPA